MLAVLYLIIGLATFAVLFALTAVVDRWDRE